MNLMLFLVAVAQIRVYFHLLFFFTPPFLFCNPLYSQTVIKYARKWSIIFNIFVKVWINIIVCL